MVSPRLFLASLLAGVVAGAPLEPRQTCYSGVYMIVARGTDEPVGEGRPAAVASAVTALLPNSGSVAVDYPATIVAPPYPFSVNDGVNATMVLLQNYIKACGSKSKIALVGFSQGGNVMTDALAGGLDKPAPINSTISKYITAVTVFGDPSFTANQTFDVGTSTRNGIFSRSLNGASLALLKTYAPILRSYCDEGDPFCASGINGTVHIDEVPTWASAAAAFIVSKNK